MNEELIKRILSSIVLIPFVLFFIIKGSFIFNFFILICLLIVIYEWNKISNNIILKFLGFIFILFSFYTIYRLRNDFNESYEILLLVTLICISTDLGGYFFGKLLKGPKLTKLSPNKTYAGMIGSFMLSILLSKIYLNYIFIDGQLIPDQTLIFIFLVSFISQAGDILISFFKRLSKIKDTGKIIPGHGGLLDRVDGMIFAFPFSYIILSTKILH
tara:strand:- start:193 stop:837 length:645 start_codon:yes stop_codon:yes gene_type:complete